MSSWRQFNTPVKPKRLPIQYNEGTFIIKDTLATVVSAYYEFPSKHGPEKYRIWVRQFLESLNSPLVFFTESSLVDFITNCRKGKEDKTHIICLEKENWAASTKFQPEFWQNQLILDPERSIHSAELYKIWYEKKEFVLRAIQQNPYKHTDFVWVDAGCVRTPTPLQNFPIASKIPTDRMVLLNVEPFLEEDLKTGFAKKNRIGGTILAAIAPVWQLWSETYDSILESYVKANKFVGKDQSIMASLVLQYPSRVSLVKPPQNSTTKWFFLLQHFSVGLPTPNRIDSTI